MLTDRPGAKVISVPPVLKMGGRTGGERNSMVGLLNTLTGALPLLESLKVATLVPPTPFVRPTNWTDTFGVLGVACNQRLKKNTPNATARRPVQNANFPVAMDFQEC
jgi:hypothetical protein